MIMRPRPLSVCLRRLLFGGTVLLLGTHAAVAFADDQAQPSPQDNPTSGASGTTANPDKAKLGAHSTVCIEIVARHHVQPLVNHSA